MFGGLYRKYTDEAEMIEKSQSLLEKSEGLATSEEAVREEAITSQPISI